jgi:hypothetical protein
MPVTYKVLPERNLIVFNYWGDLTPAEAQAAVVEAMQHPMAKSTMRHLCDVSRVTAIERDHVGMMKMQSRIIESLELNSQDVMVVFYAPTKTGLQIAQMARKSWEGLDRAIVLVQQTEAGALALLGLPDHSLDDLFLVAK